MKKHSGCIHDYSSHLYSQHLLNLHSTVSENIVNGDGRTCYLVLSVLVVWQGIQESEESSSIRLVENLFLIDSVLLLPPFFPSLP